MRILIIDDEVRIRSSLKGLFEDDGNYVKAVESGEEGLLLLEKEVFDLLMLDVMLSGIDGITTLEKVHKSHPALKVLMMSGHADLSTAVKATRLGALDFFEKPLNVDKVILAIQTVKRQINLEKRVTSLENLVGERFSMIGESEAMKLLFNEIELAAPSNSRILVSGENGTGKEMVARAVHLQSGRSNAPFISLNCAAIPGELVESELFGYEKGAFTNAVAQKEGKFEIADTGTLFLDEIGDMALSAQAKLLRVLQENEAVRVGGIKPYSFDVRVIAATNKNLKNEIAAGRFREDLFYRLNVIPIHVPALRSRLADIPLLAVYFLNQLGEHSASRARSFTPEALALLQQYTWPGNVRELNNFVERLMIMSPADSISRQDVAKVLPAENGKERDYSMPTFEDSISFREKVAEFEKQILLKGYEQTQQNVSLLARKFNMDRANLHRKLKHYGIK